MGTVRRARERMARDERGFTLIETLVAAAIVGVTVAGFATVLAQMGRERRSEASYSAARQANQDVLAYLAGAPMDAVEAAICPPGGLAAATELAPARCQSSPAAQSAAGSLVLLALKPADPGAGYSTTVTVSGSGSGPVAHPLLLVESTTRLAPADGSAGLSLAQSVLRSGIDPNLQPPSGVGRGHVPCDGARTTDNLCVPALTATLASAQAQAALSITGPAAGPASGAPTYTLERTTDPSLASGWAALPLSPARSALPPPILDTLPAGYLAARPTYFYRVSYGAGAGKVASTASPAARVTVLPTLAVSKVTADPADPGSISVSLTAAGPSDAAAYTVQASQDRSFPAGSTQSQSPAPAVGAACRWPLTLGASTAAWFFRAGYSYSPGNTAWSQTVPYTAPAE